MACFLAPMTEGIVVSILQKRAKKKEAQGVPPVSIKTGSFHEEAGHSLSASKKLGWLKNLLFGGSFLLGIEHLWHGEVIPYPPFLSALSSPDEIAPMIKEISTVGVTMAVVITLVWRIATLVIEKSRETNAQEKEE